TDYGWWGLATLHGAASGLFDARTIGDLQWIAVECWEYMDAGILRNIDIACSRTLHMEGAPNVYKRAMAHSKDDPGKLLQLLEPRYPGGVWNCDWRYDINSYNFPRMSCRVDCFCLPVWRTDEKQQWADNTVDGIQTTVMNALYLRLACGLG